MMNLIKGGFTLNNLKKFREKNCLSQRRLSEITGVNLRMIQFYETGFKNINHAHADTILRLANALNCHMEDLIEDKK